MDLHPKNRTIFFDEKLHKYTDNFKNPYTSVTTVIGKYGNEFKTEEVARACVKIGKNPSHPKYLKYKGKSLETILAEWKYLKDTACENGSQKHDYIEQVIKTSTGYTFHKGTTLINGEIYTLDDVIENPGYGELTIDFFIEAGFDKRFPVIFADLIIFANNGFRFYAEVGAYNAELLVSGLIDLFVTNGVWFIIIDWKTNKTDIRYESGYYDKDNAGNITNIFIYKNEFMLPPLNHIPDSVGYHYALQLNTYAWFAIDRGLKYGGAILYQIRNKPYIPVDKSEPTEYVTKLTIPNMIMDVDVMLKHHSESIKRKTQSLLFL